MGSRSAITRSSVVLPQPAGPVDLHDGRTEAGAAHGGGGAGWHRGRIHVGARKLTGRSGFHGGHEASSVPATGAVGAPIWWGVVKRWRALRPVAGAGPRAARSAAGVGRWRAPR